MSKDKDKKEVKQFELKVGSLYDSWRKQNQKLTLGIPKLKLDIDELKCSEECKTPEGQKKLKLLEVDLNKVLQDLEKSKTQVRMDLKKLEVPPAANGVELPKSLKKILTGEIAPGVYLTPDVKLDLKKRKIKQAGLKLKVKF